MVSLPIAYISGCACSLVDDLFGSRRSRPGESRIPLGMFCATCFKKAEEGSKFCASCRQAREGGGVAWNLPETPGTGWAHGDAASVSTERSASTDSVPWSEGTAWSPPPKSTSGAVAVAPAAAVRLAPSPTDAESEPTPRAAVQQPVPVAAQNDDYVSNPFGAPTDPQAVAPMPISPSGAPSSTPGEVALVQPPVATYVATTPAPGDITAEQAARQDIFQPRPKPAPYVVPDHELSTITELHKSPRTGMNPLVAVLSAGIVLLSLTAVGKMARDSSTSPTVSPTATTAESADTAQRFLVSAKASLQAKDYELAVSQLKKAVDELENSGAAESEVAAARMLLAQALYKQGKGQDAHDVLAKLAGGSLKADAARLSKEVDKSLRIQAETLLAQGTASLQAGNLNEALETAREAEKMMSRYGGSPDQINRARALLARAEKADGARGLAATPSQDVTYQPEVYQPAHNVRQPQPYPRHRRSASNRRATGRLDSGQDFPQARPRPQPEEVTPESLPMANAMRGRRHAKRRMPQEQAPQEMPYETQGEPEAGPGQPQQPPSGNSSSSNSSRRSRRGSDGVLPGYDTQDNGGSAY